MTFGAFCELAGVQSTGVLGPDNGYQLNWSVQRPLSVPTH
jgi:hypothetical protein